MVCHWYCWVLGTAWGRMDLSAPCLLLFLPDDGSLSLEEFQTFFDDGILSTTELHELFREIDTHKTKCGPECVCVCE